MRHYCCREGVGPAAAWDGYANNCYFESNGIELGQLDLLKAVSFLLLLFVYLLISCLLLFYNTLHFFLWYLNVYC